ncbi:Endoplasmic reticulum transmembrane protein 1, partial [Pichia kudriavzevii]
MVIVGLLLLPLPPKLQTVLISNYDKLISNPNISIILSFIDVLIGIMFVDAFKNGFGMIGKEDEVIEYSKNLWETRSRKFYSQRN